MAKSRQEHEIEFQRHPQRRDFEGKFLKNHLPVIAVILFLVVYIANGYHVYYIEQQNKRWIKNKRGACRIRFKAKGANQQNEVYQFSSQIEKRNLGLKELREPLILYRHMKTENEILKNIRWRFIMVPIVFIIFG
jgi:hypothetical protein